VRDLLVTYQPYYHCAVKPQNFTEFCAMVTDLRYPDGIWCVKTTDRFTGEVIREVWHLNVITDTGGIALLKNTWNSAGSAVAIFNQLAIAANAGSTTLTTALAANQTGVTSLAVQAVPASIPSGTTLTLGYGTSNTQTVTTSALTAAQATSISVTTFTVNATGFAIGQNVVPSPTTSDNPSSAPGAQYSGALSSGAFAYSGTGAGNRQVVISYTFNGGSATAGNYTEIFTCNANPIVAGATATHLIVPPMALNSSTNLTVQATEKL
jgi:hypothetical protein